MPRPPSCCPSSSLSQYLHQTKAIRRYLWTRYPEQKKEQEKNWWLAGKNTNKVSFWWGMTGMPSGLKLMHCAPSLSPDLVILQQRSVGNFTHGWVHNPTVHAGSMVQSARDSEVRYRKSDKDGQDHHGPKNN